MRWNKILYKGMETWTLYDEYDYALLDHTNVSLLNDSRNYQSVYGKLLSKRKLPQYEILDPGVYTVGYDGRSQCIMKMVSERQEKFLDFNFTVDILKDFKSFIKSKSIYKKMNMTYKRGILLYGPPGTGKSTLVKKIINDLKPKNSLVFFMKEMLNSSHREALREDTRLKIVIIEELAELVQYVSKSELLNFLDGEESFNNCFLLATTNNPEQLPLNIADRPGRFDRFYKIDYLGKEDVQRYAKFFIGRELTNAELDNCTKPTIASLKEIFLLVLRDSLTVLDALKVINDQSELVKTSFKESNSKSIRDGIL